MALRAKRYFEDYEVETKLQNGRQVSEYVYKGDLYVREVTPALRAKERVAYPVLAVLAALLMGVAVSRPTTANAAGVTAACSLLVLIPLFCVLEGAVEAFFRKGKLKKENYRERLVMLRAMPVAGAALGLVLAAGYLAAALRGADTAASLTALPCALAAAAIYAGIALHEFRTGYRIIKGARSTGQEPPQANEPAAEKTEE